MVANRPASGAPIESTWGGEVHDIVERATAVICGAPASSTQNVPIALTSVIEGKASMLQTGAIVLPEDGLYQVGLKLVSFADETMKLISVPLYVNGTIGGQGGTFILSTQGSSRWTLMLIPFDKLSAGDRLQVGYTYFGAGASSFTIERFSVRKVAHDYRA